MTGYHTAHEFLMGAYRALYEDAVRWIPELNRRALEWDKTHLQHLGLNRGDRYFTIDLPTFGKAFELGLEVGSLAPSEVAGFGRLKTKRGHDARPRLFWAFTSRVFKFDGTLREAPCTSSILFVRQLCYLAKKLKGDCRDEYTFKAVGELYDTERDMREPTLDWDVPTTSATLAHGLHIRQIGESKAGLPEGDLGSRVSCSDWDILQAVFDRTVGRIPALDTEQLRYRHGPGAVADGGRGISKYSFPSWSMKLDSVFPFDMFASSNFMVDGSEPSYTEVSSRLIKVPKTHKGPRLIASEPIANQWIQQGLEDFLARYFSSSFVGKAVRLADQTWNQRLAQKASLGSHATIDLSSASDRLSCYVVERVFRTRPDLLAAIMACRTSSLSNPLDKRFPNVMRIRKFAMMGSALTFPIQSLVFFCVTVASVLSTRKLAPSMRNIIRVTEELGVYGDDIIVPVDSVQTLMSNLSALGLKVNSSKSFWRGSFRESCGADWYAGECVTPAYIRSDFDPSTPSSASTVIETSNNFHSKGFWVTAAYLMERLPVGLRNKVAVHSPSSAIKGFLSYAGERLDHLRKRWNARLQRWEYRVLALEAKARSGAPDGFDRLRQYFTEGARELDLPFLGRPEYSPTLSDRTVPVLRERYVPLYSGI